MKMMILFAAVLVAFFAGAVDARKGLKSDKIEMLYADTLEPVDNWIENLKHERNLGNTNSQNRKISCETWETDGGMYQDLVYRINDAFPNDMESVTEVIDQYEDWADGCPYVISRNGTANQYIVYITHSNYVDQLIQARLRRLRLDRLHMLDLSDPNP